MPKRTRQYPTTSMKVTRKPKQTSTFMSTYSARLETFKLYRFVYPVGEYPPVATCKGCNYPLDKNGHVTIDVDVLIGLHKEIFNNYYHLECAKRIGWMEFDEQ